MVAVKPAIRLTYADYCRTPDDERYELLDGELVMSPSPKEIHQRIDMDLGRLIGNFVAEHHLGRVYSAPFDVVQPDLLFVSNEQAHIVTTDNVRGAPDLVVEILSPSTAERDRTLKRALYAEYGVQEYWLVDPDTKTVTVLVLDAGAFAEVACHGTGQTLTSPILPGFTANLDDLF